MILHNYSTHILSFFVVGLFFPIMSVSAISTLGTDFVGTTTNTDFLFQQNNAERMRLTGSGVRISTVGGYLDYRPNNVPCANGQILSWDSTNTRWTCTNDALGIAGSGLVSNYLSKWNGTTLINSTIFDNGTNVGIGTTTPGAKLDVNTNSTFTNMGTGANMYLRSSASANGDYMGFGWLGEDAWGITSADGASYKNLLLQPFSGNVGIGTSTPGAKLDVNGSINTNGIVTATGFKGGRVSNEVNGLRIAQPGGAAYATSTSVINGAIKIKLPVASFKSNTMIRMTVKIYEYAGSSQGTSRTLELGGYNYGDAAANWYHTFATQETMGGGEVNVRFGNDGTSQCIWIGETTSTWSYPQVFVTDFQGGYSNYTDAMWGTGWNISFATTLDTITQGPYTIGKNLSSQNFNSYSPTLAGVGASGTWGISITGNAATASAVPWSGVTGKPTTLAGYGITDAVNTTGDQTIGGNKTFTGDVIVQGKVVTDTLVNRTVQNLTISGSLYPYSTSSSKDLGATGNRWNNGFFGGNIAAGGWVGAGCEGECEGGGGYSLMYPNGTIVATTSVTAPSFIGNATTATTASAVPWSGVTSKPTTLAGYGITDFISSNASNPVAADAVTTNGNYYVNANIGLFGQTDGALYSQAYGPSWVGQIYQDYRTGQIALRGKNNGVWQAWRTNLDSGNYTSYAPSLTGGGASGTWGISITGNAATASAVPWSGVTGKPTTLAGYGITDAVNTTGDQTIGGNKTFTGDVIVGGATDSPLTLNKSSGTQWNYMQWNYGGVRRYWQGLDSTGQYNIRPDSSTGTILLGGRVGIGGTSTPLGTLDVYGDIAFSNNVTQPANNFARIFQEAGVGPMIAGYQFGVKTGGSGTSAPIERLRIDPSGNVGIGTTSPGERLHVNGNAIFSGTISANTPIASNHVATKAYVDAAVSAGGGDDHTIVLTTLSNNPSAGLLCGLDAAGRAYCYGGNRDFQNYPVGESANKYNGSLSGVLLPILGHLRFSAIYGNCGVTTSGRLYCWDKDSKNQLSMYEPGIVEGIDRDIQPILISSSGITISKLFSFGSKTSDPYGSTGVGGGTNCIISSTNKLYCVGGQSSLEYGYYYPRGQGLYLITGSLDFSDMATRHYTTNATSLGYTCGITTTGSGYCWGNKTLNTAGRGGTPVNDILPLGEISGGHRFSKIALGGLTDCGLTLSGAAYCWGSDHEYALGDDGAISNIYTPVAVNAGGLTFSDIVISTDWHKVCGLANSGSIYCWGDNEYLPTLKSGTGVYTKIVAAKDVVCGLSSIGTIDCTGSNNPLKRGFLGNGYTDLVVFRNDTVCGKTIDNLTYCFTSIASGSISDFNLISPYDRWDSPSRYHGR